MSRRAYLYSIPLLAVAAVGIPQAWGSPAPPGTTPAAEQAKEEEFLFYIYTQNAEQLAKAVRNGSGAIEKIAAVRDSVNRHLVHIRRGDFRDDLEDLFECQLETVDAVVDYTRKLDRIDRGILADREQRSSETGFNAGKAGGLVGGTAYREGATGGDAAVAGLAVAAAAYLLEDARNRRELSEQKKRAVEDATDELRRVMSPIEARESYSLGSIPATGGWTRGKEGEWIHPIGVRIKFLVELYMKADGPDAAVAAVKKIVQARDDVPDAPIYEEYRVVAGYYAARLLTWAAEQRLGDRRWGAVDVEEARSAVEAWEDFLSQPHALSPKDKTDAEHQRIIALCMAGEYERAAPLAVDLNQRLADAGDQSRQFCLTYARLCSCSGEFSEKTLSFVRFAIAGSSFSSALDAMDPVGVKEVRDDVNLQDLRTGFPEEFDELFKVNTTWHVDWGLFSDDIELTNKSSFPLEDVVLEVSIQSSEGTWTRKFRTPKLNPGQKKEWNTKIGSRGDDWKGTATYTYDLPSN